MASGNDERYMSLREAHRGVFATACEGPWKVKNRQVRTVGRKREVSMQVNVKSEAYDLRQTTEQVIGHDLDASEQVAQKTPTRGGDPVRIRGGMGSPTDKSATCHIENAQTTKDSRPQRPIPHVFIPFWLGPDMSNDTINRDIRATVSKPLSSDELRAADAGGGYVYLFCLPGWEAVSPPTRHVKIGMTTRSVAGRMQRIASRCGYEPSVIRSVLTRYPLRVERLCHSQLRGQRRRESPGCPGCGLAHREWFEVSPPEAERVVCFWSEWIEYTVPYSKGTGELKVKWRGKLGDVQVHDEPDRCWGRFCEVVGVTTRPRGENETSV